MNCDYDYVRWWVAPSTDADADGHQAIGSCGVSPRADDCNNNDPTVYPGAAELCDNKDNNCDGQFDEGLSTDADGDGHYTLDSCKTPKDDCDDSDPEIYPGAPEICDGKDNNCDGPADETCEGCTQNNTDTGSSANLASGNLYHSQDILSIQKGLTLSFAYNSIDTYAGPFGKGWTHNYNINITQVVSNTLSLMQGDGKRVYFNLSGGTYYPEARTGEYSTIIKNVDGTYTLTTKEGTIYTFNSSGKLTSIKDRNNNTFALTYTDDNLTSIIDSTGRITTLTYDSLNKIIQITDTMGRVTTLGYNTNGYLSTVTDPPGNTWQYTYDADGRMLSKTDSEGNISTYTYDSQGRITTSTNPSGTKTISYDQINNIATITERDGGVWTHIYDPLLNVPLEITDPQGGITTYVYDLNSNLISKTDPNGNTINYTYDSNGNMTSITDPLANTTIYTYNSYGQITSITDPLGRVTGYSYDSNGNLISVTDSGGAITQFQYDSKGNITKIINALGHETNYNYDQYNNLISTTNPEGETTTFTYDLSGNMTGQTDALGNTNLFEYNSLNQLIKVTDPLGNVSDYTYDFRGNKISMTDVNGNTTYYEYNHKNQLTKVTDPLGNITQYSYVLDDKLAMVTDAKNHSISYEYDQLGRLIRMTDQLGRIETYSYDSNGNLISVTDRKGQTTTYTYDQVNRLRQVTYADGSYTTYTYDSAGRLTTITDSISGTISYTYSDSGCGTGCSGMDKVTNETTPQGSISYTYDAIGRRISMTVSGQPTVYYSYDSNSRLTWINTQLNGVPEDFAFSHDSIGRKTSTTFPNGVTTNYTYDNASRVLNIEHLSPLSSVLEALSFVYDANGNRTSMNRPAVNLPSPNPVSNTSYNEANQMLTFNNKIMTYDENGNMTSVTNGCGTTTYTWDVRNRLIGIAGYKPDCTPLTASFKYDALSRRIEKTITGEAIQYLYDGLDIVQEIENSIVIVNYIRTLNIDEPLARIESNGTVRYYQTDALGSVITLTDENGNARTTYAYDPYGNVTVSGDSSDNPFQYTGRENDGTGLHYYRFRYYSPELQRFISEDPIGLAGGINLYSYVGSNPINRTDLLGLFWDGPDIGDPGRIVPGRGPSCVSALQEMASIARQVRSGVIGDKRGHCLAHCKVKKACGRGFGDALSMGIGYGKEAYDWGYGQILGGRDWDPADIGANEQGRTCPPKQTCEDRCKNLWR